MSDSTPQAETGSAVPFWRSVPFIILCGCVIATISFGPRSAMGLFLAPMTEAKGWTREIFALSIAVQNLLWGIGQPIAGALADRYGTGRVLAGGGVLYALSLFAMSWAPSPLWLHLSAGVGIGIALAACSFSIVLAAFGRIVTPAQRSIAFGIGTAAGSFGQFLFAPLGQALISNYGWQQALVLLGGLMLVLPLFAMALKGKPAPHAVRPGEKDQSMVEALTEAFGYRSYLLLVAGFFVCGFHVAFITVHLPAFIVDKGLDPSWGGWAIALIGLFNIVGSLVSGALGGRLPKQLMLAAIYAARGVVIMLFVLLPVTPVTVLAFSATIGFLWLSTVPPTSGLIAVMFGPRYMATLFGFAFFSHQIGSFLGVWLGGLLYDRTGSYDVVWWLGVALAAFAAVVHLPIKDSPVARLMPAE
ncbi:MFS transporter [Breoghania sp. L-A4]|uniref:MFS transporter n=1 Tax=Breoghania sp. L-A4 TaxID=2304600 RepID=UPI000E35E9E4|nr:MFS transporter [Breoghania sp. L-A4]AXS39550.1 MFS transporter [Breoghania sp. L-A4]